jgi:hypothetical protein
MFITTMEPTMKHLLTPAMRLVSCAGTAALVMLQPVHAEETPVLASHRAVYSLTLAEAGAGSNVTDIRGELVYDFRGSACQGYTLNTRLITEVFDREGKATTNDIRSESWEDGEGKRLRFTTSQYANGRLSESTKGIARRPAYNADTIAVDLEKPRKTNVTIPGKILFPTQHSLTVLKAALAGRTHLQADIYDGSEKGMKVYETSTVIGPPLELSANSQLPAIKNGEALSALPSWPVVVSYYDQGPRKDGLPSYEVSFRMYPNGVSRKLKLDYGTFSLSGELSSIEFLETKPCP